jgi:hypothetical protein
VTQCLYGHKCNGGFFGLVLETVVNLCACLLLVQQSYEHDRRHHSPMLKKAGAPFHTSERMSISFLVF